LNERQTGSGKQLFTARRGVLEAEESSEEEMGWEKAGWQPSAIGQALRVVLWQTPLLQQGKETGQGEWDGPQDRAPGEEVEVEVEVECELENDEKNEPSTEDTQKWAIGKSSTTGWKRMTYCCCIIGDVLFFSL